MPFVATWSLLTFEDLQIHPSCLDHQQGPHRGYAGWTFESCMCSNLQQESLAVSISAVYLSLPASPSGHCCNPQSLGQDHRWPVGSQCLRVQDKQDWRTEAAVAHAKNQSTAAACIASKQALRIAFLSHHNVIGRMMLAQTCSSFILHSTTTMSLEVTSKLRHMMLMRQHR